MCRRCGGHHDPALPCHTWARRRRTEPPLVAVSGSLGAGTLVAGRYRLHAPRHRLEGITRYSAHDLERGRAVWVDLLDPGARHDARRRFLRGAAIGAALPAHPNVVPLVDRGEVELDDGPQAYAVLAHQDGESLAERIAWRDEASIEEACTLLRGVLEGLAHAHRHGVLHRELTAARVWLVPRPGGGETVRLAGVGLACGFDAVSVPGIQATRPTGMSPEEAMGEPTDVRSDLYCAASLAWLALVGQPPFVERSFSRYLRRLVQDPPPRLRFHRPDAPSALEGVLRAAMAKDPADRPASAEAFLELLEACCPSRSTLPPPLRG